MGAQCFDNQTSVIDSKLEYINAINGRNVVEHTLNAIELMAIQCFKSSNIGLHKRPSPGG